MNKEKIKIIRTKMAEKGKEKLSLGERIEINPEVMVGKPVICGTRITVELILRQVANGVAIEEILENYPHLVKEDIYAALGYAVRLVEEETIFPLQLYTHDKDKVFA